jgi:hypothetical protein
VSREVKLDPVQARAGVLATLEAVDPVAIFAAAERAHHKGTVVSH